MTRGLTANRSRSGRVIKQKRSRSGSTAQNSQQRVKRKASSESQDFPPHGVSSALPPAVEPEESDMSESEASEDELETVRHPDVFNKFREAGRVVDDVLQEIVTRCVPGASTKALCAAGDTGLLERTKSLFRHANSTAHQSSTPASPVGGDVGGRATSSGNTRPASRAPSGRAASRRDSRNQPRSQTRTLSRASSRRGFDKNPLSETFTTGVPRGICVPTTISVNETLCHHSPFLDEDAITLKTGDVVKVHCGAHLDGYPVMTGRTIIVPHADARDETETSAGGKSTLSVSAINAIEAARVSVAAVVHMLRPGALNADITDAIAQIGGYYNVEALEGVLSTRIKRWVLDSVSNSIICRRVVTQRPQMDVGDCVIKPFQTWNVDVAFTNSPSYKTQTSGEKVNSANLYRRNEVPPRSGFEDFRSNSAADLLRNEVLYKFHNFVFHPLHCEDPMRARLGLAATKKQAFFDELPEIHCKRLSHTKTYGVNGKKEQPITARFSCTVALSDKRLHVLCGGQGLVVPLPNREEGSNDKGNNYHFQPAANLHDGFIPDAEMPMLAESDGADFTSSDGASVNNSVPLRLEPPQSVVGLLRSPLTFSTLESRAEAKKRVRAEARHNELIAPTSQKRPTSSSPSKLASMHPDAAGRGF